MPCQGFSSGGICSNEFAYVVLSCLIPHIAGYIEFNMQSQVGGPRKLVHVCHIYSFAKRFDTYAMLVVLMRSVCLGPTSQKLVQKFESSMATIRNDLSTNMDVSLHRHRYVVIVNCFRGGNTLVVQ